MIMKQLKMAFVALAVSGFSAGASAQFAKPEDAIKYRKNALFVMQQHYARVAGMAAGKIPFNSAAAAENAAIAETVGRLPWAGFGDGTDQGETKASNKIWSEKARFQELADKMQSEMGKLAAAAKTGDLESIKAAVKATSGSCKACHDDYRLK